MVTTPDQKKGPPTSSANSAGSTTVKKDSPSPPSGLQPTLSQLLRTGGLGFPPGTTHSDVEHHLHHHHQQLQGRHLRGGGSDSGGGGGQSPHSKDLEHFAAAQRLAALISASNMKVPPITLPTGQLPMPLTADLLWRYPNPFMPQPPPSPLESHLKAHLPAGLGHDPRHWSREDVSVFMRYCEGEFDLERIDMDKFQMNGKALCLLNKMDLAERCSGAGDVIHNILQLLIRESSGFPPNSPLTPRPPGLMTPTSPAFPASPWPLLTGAVSSANESAGAGATFPTLSHLISQTNSVTLSPAPSIDSQNGGSPKHNEALAAAAAAAAAAASTGITSIHQLYPNPKNNLSSSGSQGQGKGQSHSHTNGNGRAPSGSSSHSDSEDSAERSPSAMSTPRTPTGPMRSPRDAAPTSSTGKEETPELNTNGRLLWDFLQQLLNDSQQRYTNYIAWKDKETGVFKIVDPAGLAKLWGIQKNHLSMNYDKMSRALRYYYRVNILRKVQGERHCYQFLRNPSELKSIKNISLLRQQMEAQAAAHKLASQQAAQQAALHGLATVEEGSNGGDGDRPESPLQGPITSSSSYDEPTDLSMDTEEKRARLHDRYKREFMSEQRSSSGSSAEAAISERDREQHESRFHYSHLIPQVSIKTENF
ncbi:ets DNA-binding protein pokkuri-like isoform X2 [Tigriopus californicus]|uniref:ets DNA-binding protein pokkuri-like isoform X2 n=1 Tax=Tigriopus californicus TaxID=6832 RepID=UPI0027D9F534|nr:ets DNA-binding protein pokkuri-like isoform X2 [Tigriopus californicus]